MHGYLPYTYAIVGVQKAGTTTLSGLLKYHGQICRAPTKELRFFDDDSRDWQNPDYSDYRCPRRKPHHRVAGDASPAYLFWPHALERMRAYNPDMRLIAAFRDPIERAFSAWSMERGRTADYADFSDFVASAPRSLRYKTPRDDRRFRTRRIVMRGYYGEQLRRGYATFDPEQWLLLDFHTMFGDVGTTLDAICDHIGVRRFKTYPDPYARWQSPTNLSGRPPTGGDIEKLAGLYADDLAAFAELSGIDVSRWSTARILAGTLDPGDLAEKLGRKAGLIPA